MLTNLVYGIHVIKQINMVKYSIYITKYKEEKNISKNIRVVIGLISNIILFVFGIRGLLINEPKPFVSYLFTIGGLIGIIALLLELKKRNTAESSNSEQI